MQASALLDPLSGASRVHFIVGDPIAQVRSPAGVTADFLAAGRNAYVLPAQVAAADLSEWMAGVSRMRNLDGVIVTVPHKFSCHAFCASHSEGAAFLGAVNMMRRRPDGLWHGDMSDGDAYVEALREKGFEPASWRVLLVGAGGAGSAIAYALARAGLRELALHDADTARRDALLTRLAAAVPGVALRAGSTDPEGYDALINATPMGMQAGDPLPLRAEALRAHQVVGCVITSPAISPLVAAARARGCVTVTGGDMFAKVRERLVRFLLNP